MKKRKKNKVIKHKQGVSAVIGYVLLVVFAIIIGAIVYQWLVTYVPSESLECTDGVSLFLEEVSFDTDTGELNLIIRNNGRFSVAGYFVYGSNVSGGDTNIDLSPYLSSGGAIFGSSILAGVGNSLQPGEEISSIFEIDPAVGEILEIRIIPTRFEEVDEKQRFLSCTSARVTQETTDPDEGVEGFGGGGGGLMGGGGGSSLFIFGFESSAQGWVDGGADSDRSNVRSQVQDDGSLGGTWSWHLTGNLESATIQQNFDFSGGYSQIRIDFWGWWENSFGNNECVELLIDDVTAESFGSGTGCGVQVSQEDVWLQQSVFLDSGTYTFDQVVQVKFEGEMGSGDDFYLDGINITGIT